MNITQICSVTASMSNSGEPLSDRLNNAALNTLLGMGIVFLVLILIILIISMFKIFPYLQNKRMEKQNQNSISMDNAIAHIIEQEKEELIDDSELVAVITAAIYASMGNTVPADGLIVRSIRKINNRRKY